MTYEEAAREWNKYIRCQEKGESNECNFDCDKCGNEMEISIDLVRTSIEALEKQIPKKPYAETAFYGACPSCSRTIDTDYCQYCGQAIKWSEVE